MRVIIIDDEAQSHEVLKSLLSTHHPDMEVIASGYGVREGIRLVETHQPELVFLDIEMPDGSGFDLLEQVGQPLFQIIFITAHEHYARTAIKFGALDYLLKPVVAADLAEALQRARRKKKEYISPQQLAIMWETLAKLKERTLPSLLSISTMDGIVFKPVEDIIRLEAQQNYTEFTLAGEKKKILASVNLGEYADQFEPYREFMKVHRSHVVNLRYVDRYVRSDGGYLVMTDNSQISVSRLYREELLKRMRQL